MSGISFYPPVVLLTHIRPALAKEAYISAAPSMHEFWPLLRRVPGASGTAHWATRAVGSDRGGLCKEGALRYGLISDGRSLASDSSDRDDIRKALLGICCKERAAQRDQSEIAGDRRGSVGHRAFHLGQRRFRGGIACRRRRSVCSARAPGSYEVRGSTVGGVR